MFHKLLISHVKWPLLESWIGGFILGYAMDLGLWYVRSLWKVGNMAQKMDRLSCMQ